MKKLLIIAIVLLVVILVAILILFLFTPAPKIITGMAAKRVCSCYYLAGRSPESVMANENNYSFIKYSKVKVDESKKTVTATLLGLGKITAVYREGLGCSIVTKDYPLEKLRATQYQPIDNPIYATDIFSESNLEKPVFNKKKLDEVIDEAFVGKKKRTRAVIVVKDGQIIGEKYSEGIDKNSLLLGWSMTKSVTNAISGIMVEKGMIDINTPVNIPEWKNDDRSKITWNNLLQMSSGLKWSENYFWISDVTKMLNLNGDMYGQAIQSKTETAPDKKFLYSSGTTNIVAGLQRQQFEDINDYWQFPYKELFHKIGMNSAVMEPDASGTFVGSSYCFATARDWAKFGLLYLNDGLWQGERILPEGWAKYTATPASQSEGIYGSFFWLNAGGEYPDAPRDSYGAQGFQGQYVYVVPSENLVVVRLGLSGVGNFDFNDFLSNIIAAVR